MYCGSRDLIYNVSLSPSIPDNYAGWNTAGNDIVLPFDGRLTPIQTVTPRTTNPPSISLVKWGNTSNYTPGQTLTTQAPGLGSQAGKNLTIVLNNIVQISGSTAKQATLSIKDGTTTLDTITARDNTVIRFMDSQGNPLTSYQLYVDKVR